MKKNLLMYVVLLSSTIITCGCTPKETTSLSIEGVVVSSKDNVREIKVDETLQLSASVYPLEASQEVSWASSNETVASVNASGLVSALSVGNASIIATSIANSSISQSFSIIVKEKDVVEIVPTSVKIDSAEISKELKTGESITLSATVLPVEASQSVEWTSSDETIASVRRGEVTALKEGSVTISVNAKDYADIKDSITLNITKSDDVVINKDYETMSYVAHADFMTLDNETPVKVKGVVSYILPLNENKVSYYIQNGSEGYYVYAQDYTSFPVELGKSYEVGGLKKYYRGNNEIVDVEYFKELNENLTYTISDLNGKNPSSVDEMSEYHNSYIKGIAQIEKAVTPSSKAYSVSVKINDASTVLRVDPSYMTAEEFTTISDSFSLAVVGSNVEFSGIMTAFGYGKPSNQIQILKSSDLKFAKITPMDEINAVSSSLLIQSSFSTSDTTIVLPTNLDKFANVDITWSSDSALIDVENGTVTHGSNDAVVTLTATIQHKEDASASVTKTFKVSVYGTSFEHEEIVSFDLEDAISENLSYGNSPSKPSYAEGNVTLGNPKKTWMLRNALISSTDNDHFDGKFSIRTQAASTHEATGRIEILEAGEYNYVQFSAAVYGNDNPGIRIGVEYTTDDGKTWIDSQTIITINSSELQMYRVALPSGNKRIAIYVVENSGKRVNIDNIKLYK